MLKAKLIRLTNTNTFAYHPPMAKVERSPGQLLMFYPTVSDQNRTWSFWVQSIERENMDLYEEWQGSLNPHTTRGQVDTRRRNTSYFKPSKLFILPFIQPAIYSMIHSFSFIILPKLQAARQIEHHRDQHPPPHTNKKYNTMRFICSSPQLQLSFYFFTWKLSTAWCWFFLLFSWRNEALALYKLPLHQVLLFFFFFFFFFFKKGKGQFND